eukprot:c13042_g1_i1 orf=868-2682(-)
MGASGTDDKATGPNQNSGTRRNDERTFSDLQSDFIVQVDGVAFALHKFPLLSRSGKIRKLVAEIRESDASQIELSDLPGGSDVFELTAKFCYGVYFEITTSNVAALFCAAEYLEMTEDYGTDNLLARCEVFLNEIVLQSLEKSIETLHSCEDILPYAEEMKIVGRCIDAVASKACWEQGFSSSNNSDHLIYQKESSPQQKIGDLWAEDLTILRIDLFQRVLGAMRSRGMSSERIGGVLMLYAQRSLQSLIEFDSDILSRPEGNNLLKHEQRLCVETIVSLLPVGKNILSTSFLFGLLRAAIIVDTTVACRLDLERRIGLQLEKATLDDLLIPSTQIGETVFEVDIVYRVLLSFFQQNEDLLISHPACDSNSPSRKSVVRVVRLIDAYLAEIATDVNLKLSKFVAFAELLPDNARATDDALYRAIDIYLKAHPNLPDLERRKICKVMDCQKLSQEACAHAAQNERLPVQAMVQVLYFEQLRLRKALGRPYTDAENVDQCHPSQRTASNPTLPRDNNTSLRRENRELKLEFARMKTRLDELEREHENMKQEMEKTASTNGFLTSVSKRFGKMNLFTKNNSKESNIKLVQQKPEFRIPSRRRRHSVS